LKIKPFRTLLRNTSFCSLGEVGSAGAEPPQNLPAAAEVVQTVLPLEWSGRKRGQDFLSCSRFRRRNGNGKNPDGQRFKGGDFFALFAKKYYPFLDRLDSRNGAKCGLPFAVGHIIISIVAKRQIGI